jgi:diguanylate cyclase (GGDEF)-like protein
VGDTETARAEAQAARVEYRMRVRLASLAIVFGVAVALALSAALPTTRPVDRAGLLVSAGLTLAAGIVWLALVQRRPFSYGRMLLAAAIAQGVMVIMLGLTGGMTSTYFPYYLVPTLLMILSGDWRHATVLGTAAGAGAVGLAVSGTLDEAVRDLTVTRLLEIGIVTFFAATAAMATGESRRTLAARTQALLTQRDDAFHMAITDELTGLYNRYYMREELRRMTAHASRRDRPFAILSLDVDGLKAVNDSRGHQAGDALLRGIADALRSVLRSEDIAVRTGGDEFVVLLPDADRGEAVKVAYRIRQRVAAIGDHGVSTGIAVWRRGSDPEEALRDADAELYRAKAARAASPTR